MGRSPTDADRDLGENIRQARRVRGMSQDSLADKVGVTQQQIQKWETAENRISAVRLRDVCDALSFTPDALLRRATSDMPKKIEGAEQVRFVTLYMGLSKRKRSIVRGLLRELRPK